MKKYEIRSALEHLAEKLDIQWKYGQSIQENDAAAEALIYNEDGELMPNRAQIAYHGMTAAFESMGGEWHRRADGTHQLFLLGVGATATED